MSFRKKRFPASVDFKDAEDVRRGWGIAHAVESEGRARDGLQLRASVQSQEARHLAGLQEVERVRPGRRGRPVTLHALQLLRPRAAGHHVQLHILRLLLVEQHLRRRRRWRKISRDTRRTCFFSTIQMKTNQTASGLPKSCYRNSFFLLFWLIFSRPLSTWQDQSLATQDYPETRYPPLQKTWYVPVQYDWCLCQ